MTAFTVAGGRDLTETFINDLRMQHSEHLHAIDPETEGVGANARRQAVIILYATGMVAVFEGWAIKRDDIPELLAAKVLTDG